MASRTSPFVGRLVDGPVDIIGDIHGEIDALNQLLEVLGYAANGEHQESRRLAFLGDLVDRGPDSPAVVDKVIRLVQARQAQCLAGNHELNILLGRPLPGNGWFVQPNALENPGDFSSTRVDPERIDEYLAFFSHMPVVLQNDALRLVHACWHPESVAAIAQDVTDGVPLADLYRRYEIDVQKRLNDAELAHMIEHERMFYAVELDNPDWQAESLPAHAEAELIGQNSNPIRALTTGIVQQAEQPFFAVGRWRMADRRRWWDDYEDEVPVVIGHFWRRFQDASERVPGVFGRDIFEGIPSHAWMGARKNVYCVDYSVGQRHRERQSGTESGYTGKLAALRYPEWQVFHDDGAVVQLEAPGGR